MKCAVILLLAIPAILPAQAPLDYSGTWKLDPLRSRLERTQVPKSLVLQIDQHDTDVRVKLTSMTSKGENTEIYQPRGTGQGPSVTWDDGHLVLVSQHDTADGPVSVTRRLKRGDKGKIMTSVLNIKDKSGESTEYEFFIRE
ncbi:MAG: hypothetical protein U0Q18_27210 [Bryobacteraceae bacterium]